MYRSTHKSIAIGDSGLINVRFGPLCGHVGHLPRSEKCQHQTQVELAVSFAYVPLEKASLMLS